MIHGPGRESQWLGEGGTGVWKKCHMTWLTVKSARSSASPPPAGRDSHQVCASDSYPGPLITMTCPLDLFGMWGWRAGWGSEKAPKPEVGRPHLGW